MPSAPYFKFFAKDFLLSPNQMQLSLTGAGLFVRVLCLLWLHNEDRDEWQPLKLPGGPMSVLRFVGNLSGWEDIDQEELENELFGPHGPLVLFERNGLFWVNSPRLESEFEEMVRHRMKSKLGGKRSGQVRRKASRMNPPSRPLEPPLNQREEEEEEEEEVQSKSTLPIGRESTRTSTPFDAEVILAWWRHLSLTYGLPNVRALTKSRRDKARSRWTGVPFRIREVREQFERAVAAQPFLTGDNKRGWRMSFDWLMANDHNAQRVLEGAYAEGKARSDLEKQAERLLKEYLSETARHGNRPEIPNNPQGLLPESA